MIRFGVCTRQMWKRSLALAFFAVVMLPALALSQIDSTTSSTTTQSSETAATTTTTTTYLYDWRVWAAVGAVLLVILVIAVSRGRGDSSTTVIK